jgi:hypothetical protein
MRKGILHQFPRYLCIYLNFIDIYAFTWCAMTQLGQRKLAQVRHLAMATALESRLLQLVHEVDWKSMAPDMAVSMRPVMPKSHRRPPMPWLQRIQGVTNAQVEFYGFFLGGGGLVLLLLGPLFFQSILFLYTTLLTRMTSISLHMQWPMTSQSHGSFLKENNCWFCYGSNSSLPHYKYFKWCPYQIILF